MASPPLVAQTTYAELLERCANAAFDDAFAGDGTFVSKTVKGRKYWYFQMRVGTAREQRYVGPETPELLARIANHKAARDDERERRALVSALVRSFGFPSPIAEIGDVLAALAKAGVFRLRGVLVGTIAYQTYAAMLGTRFPTTSAQTGDIDIAQFRDVSVAVGDSTAPMLDILKQIDPTFRAVPHLDSRRSTSYTAKGGLRVDFLTPDKGQRKTRTQTLPALQTDAQLHFLDFLIHDPEPAVVLRGSGIYVHVPAPARYAIHKLILSQRRPEGLAKRDKDLRQAETLLEVLGKKRPSDLISAWQMAHRIGPAWRKSLEQGLAAVGGIGRDWLLKTLDRRRSTVAGLDLTFSNPAPRYDFSRDVVSFAGHALGSEVDCEISRETLDDHFGTDGSSQKERIEAFLKFRSQIELMARAKYLSWPIEEPGKTLIKTLEVPKLAKEVALKDRR